MGYRISKKVGCTASAGRLSGGALAIVSIVVPLLGCLSREALLIVSVVVPLLVLRFWILNIELVKPKKELRCRL